MESAIFWGSFPSKIVNYFGYFCFIERSLGLCRPFRASGHFLSGGFRRKLARLIDAQQRRSTSRFLSNLATFDGEENFYRQFSKESSKRGKGVVYSNFFVCDTNLWFSCCSRLRGQFFS